MILIDVNLLLYAHDRGSPHHEAAAAWLASQMSGAETIRLSWVGILAFLRISTSRRILGDPYHLHEAMSIVSKWLSRAQTGILNPGHHHWQILGELLPKAQARGNLAMDAHLAALAIEHGATLYTNDRDFARFPGLKVEFPLQ